jgi:hypothetical protein
MLEKDALYHDGIRGRAVVVKVIRRSGGGTSQPGQQNLRLRMPIDDGSILDATCPLDLADIGDLIGVDDVLPVRYDADDHSNIKIDIPIFQEHLDASTYSPLGTWHPIERLRRLNDLHDHGLLNDEEFAEAQANVMEDD